MYCGSFTNHVGRVYLVTRDCVWAITSVSKRTGRPSTDKTINSNWLSSLSNLPSCDKAAAALNQQLASIIVKINNSWSFAFIPLYASLSWCTGRVTKLLLQNDYWVLVIYQWCFIFIGYIITDWKLTVNVELDSIWKEVVMASFLRHCHCSLLWGQKEAIKTSGQSVCEPRYETRTSRVWSGTFSSLHVSNCRLVLKQIDVNANEEFKMRNKPFWNSATLTYLVHVSLILKDSVGLLTMQQLHRSFNERNVKKITLESNCDARTQDRGNSTDR
jgi:hypothetical protein